jgi:antitoxin CptB
MNELELLKNKIKYRASYRGTKEMDILLTSFVSSVINKLEYLELLKLDEFLNLNDEDIYNYYSNGSLLISFNDSKILDLFRKFKI